MSSSTRYNKPTQYAKAKAAREAGRIGITPGPGRPRKYPLVVYKSPERSFNIKPGRFQYSALTRVGKAGIFEKGITTKQQAIEFFDASLTSNLTHALPLPNSLQMSTTNNFKKNISVSTTAGYQIYYIFQFTPSQGFCVSFGTVPQQDQADTPFTFHNFDELSSAGPANIRNSRMTIAINNLSNATVASGSISVLTIPNGLEWEYGTSQTLTGNFQNEIKNMMNNHPRSKTMPGGSFLGQSEHNKFSLIPASMAKLEEWNIFLDHNNLTAGIKTSLTNGANNFSHATVIVKFDITSAVNNYNLVVNGQYALRWAANSILATMIMPTQKDNRSKVEKGVDILAGSTHHTETRGGIA